MARGYKEMLAAADAEVRSLSVEEAAALGADPEVVFVDVRDPRELEREGMIPGARHATRGMLEFWIDPESPYHKPWFAEDRLFVFYCAAGWRSLLAAQTAQEMGLRVASLSGGFGAWRAAGAPVAERRPRPAEGQRDR
jgi:rhodanese-related sulfurtransferase